MFEDVGVLEVPLAGVLLVLPDEDVVLLVEEAGLLLVLEEELGFLLEVVEDVLSGSSLSIKSSPSSIRSLSSSPSLPAGKETFGNVPVAFCFLLEVFLSELVLPLPEAGLSFPVSELPDSPVESPTFEDCSPEVVASFSSLVCEPFEALLPAGTDDESNLS